jgi:hypothetical protein
MSSAVFPYSRNMLSALQKYSALVDLQTEYAAWLEALLANLHDSSLAESLQAICDIDLGELQVIESPRGFGRD